MKTIKTVCIIGMGLIGGSIGMALKKNRLVEKVIGLGRNIQRLNQALTANACDEVTTHIAKGVHDADLVFLAVPVNIIPSILKRIIPLVKKECIISDVGSVKEELTNTSEEIISSWTSMHSDAHINFVGGHPMAGSEQSGVEAAREDLFLNATCILTPTKNTNNNALSSVSSLWQQIGANVLIMPPDTHDSLVASSSHLPHIIAASMVNLIEKLSRKNKHISGTLAGSFNDITRVASSNPELWTNLCIANKKNILIALQEFILLMLNMAEHISESDERLLNNDFKTARNSRDKLYGQNNNKSAKIRKRYNKRSGR